MTFPVQVSENNRGRIFVIGGADADEFHANAVALLGGEDAAAALLEEFKAVFAPKEVTPEQAVQTAQQLLGATPVADIPPTNGSVPSCVHGPRKYVPAGVSKRTGNAYPAFWGCEAPQGTFPKCKPVTP